MCGGIKYTDKTGKEWAIYFPSPKAALPVLKRDGDIEWVTWGKRKEEEDRFFAPGGWARIDSIHEGKWKRFHPRPVLLPLNSFMEKDHEKKSHWFEVPPGQVIQGLLAIHDDQARVYVVTMDTPAEYYWIHDRWPRIVDASKSENPAMEKSRMKSKSLATEKLILEEEKKVKKVALIDLAVTAANLGNNIHNIEDATNDPLIRQAIEMTTNRPIEEMWRDQEAFEGAINASKGKYFELLVQEKLNAGEQVGDLSLPSDFEAQIAQSMNQPGWDIAITGADGQVVDTIQLKATDSANYIHDTLEKYPDIKILSTSEVANINPGSGIVLDSGINNSDLEKVLGHALGENGTDFSEQLIDAFHPLFPLIFILGTEGYKIFLGKKSVESSLASIQQRSIRSLTGGAVGAVCYALGFGWFSVIPSVLAAKAGPDGIISYFEKLGSSIGSWYGDWADSWQAGLAGRLTDLLNDLNSWLQSYGEARISMVEFTEYLKREGYNPRIPIIDDAKLGWFTAGYPRLVKARKKYLLDEAEKELQKYLNSEI